MSGLDEQPVARLWIHDFGSFRLGEAVRALGSSAASLRVLAAPLISKFVGYLGIGAVCAMVDIIVFWSLWRITGLIYTSFGISFVISTGLNYCLCVFFLFKPSGRGREATIFLIYLVSIIGVAIDLALFTTAIELFGTPPLLAKVLSIAGGFGWNFASRYFWIFR